MEKARTLMRFYQQMSAKPFFVMLYRITDSFENKRTLSVIFEIKGLEMKMRYQMYSSWTSKGLPHSISNLKSRARLPEPKPLFLSEQIEDEILDIMDVDLHTMFINRHFSNVLERIKNVLKSENLNRVEERLS